MTDANPQDYVVRAEDTGNALLDNDGMPIRELAPDSVDALLDHGASVAELAQQQRTWRYGHVIVDEAQDLTAMQWRMVARRARGGSMTIVGDLAQRSIGPPGRWTDHLPDGLPEPEFRELATNYRSPREITDVAADLLAELAPDLTPAQAIRSSGRPVEVVAAHDEDALLAETQAAILMARANHRRGRVAVLSVRSAQWRSAVADRILDDPQVVWLDPWRAKGLEFDAVVLVEPAEVAALENGLSHLYVAVTRATGTLTIVHRAPLPGALDRALS